MAKDKSTEAAYKVTFTRKQMAVVREALEIYSRLKAGQIDSAVIDAFHDRYCSLECPDFNHVVKQDLDAIKRKVFPELHANESYGVGSVGSKVYPEQSIAWDIMQCLRYRLAWDRLNDEGKDKPEHFGVQYQRPMQFGTEPLPVVVSVLSKIP